MIIYRKFGLGIIVCLMTLTHANIIHAESLVSPHFEIDALNFILSDSAKDYPPPVISNIKVSSVTGTSAIIQWDTDIQASSIIAFGLSNLYGIEMGQSEDKVTAHTVKLIGLSPNNTYHYQVKSANAVGHVVKSDDQVLGTTSQLNIAEVQISDITLTTAIVSWKTATLISSSVRYGKTTAYGSAVADQSAGSTTNHTIRLTNLESGATYHFQITGTDTDNTQASSDDYVFTTLKKPEILSYSIGTVTGNTAEISWETNTATDSFISFWKADEDESKALSQGSPDLVTSHHIVIVGLTGKTEFRFRIVGRDINGNKAETDTLTFVTPQDTAPPVISEVKSEISTSTKDDRLQLVVSWNTDEPATSQVEYTIGLPNDGNYKLKSKLDNGLSLNHTLVVDNLKPSTNYHFRVIATDAANNTGHSPDRSVLTPQKQKSLLQIILAKLEETFGWLRKVKA